jgi:hypothetical protein
LDYLVGGIELFELEFMRNMETKEENLVTVFESYLVNNMKNKNYSIMKELDCWQGRADIVQVFHESNFEFNAKQGLILINLTNARIVSLLHYKSPRTMDFLEKRTYLNINTLKKTIRELLKNEIIINTNTGSFLLHPSFKIPNICFEAYEAKLSNWKRALYQAIQYKGFACSSSVIMPSKHIPNVLNHKKDFEINGIGLLEMKVDGSVKIHIKAKKSRPRRKDFFLVGVGKFIEFLQ